jgi:hypothetical protein
MKQRSFPAVVIASLLLLVCIFPIQGWLTHLFPAISGRATLDPGMTIFDIPIHLPFAIDLILVPGLFIILYSITILTFSSHLPQRLAAVFISIITILSCLAAGSLVSWLLYDHIPARIREGMRSLAVNANLHTGYSTVHLFGDTLTLLGLIIGIAISIRIMSKSPKVPMKTRLTPEQRMTPYQRMLRERQIGTPVTSRKPVISRTPPTPRTPRHYEPSHGLCRNEPLLTLQPEAVNFRPLG